MKKCPFCELNYIKDDDRYCRVCARDMHVLDDPQETVEMCIVCGEYPVQPGSELCSRCIREHKRIVDLSGNDTYSDEAAEDILDESEELKEVGMSIELTPSDNTEDGLSIPMDEDFTEGEEDIEEDYDESQEDELE